MKKLFDRTDQKWLLPEVEYEYGNWQLYLYGYLPKSDIKAGSTSAWMVSNPNIRNSRIPLRMINNFVFEATVEYQATQLKDLDSKVQVAYPLLASSNAAIIRALALKCLEASISFPVAGSNPSTYLNGAWTFAKAGTSYHVVPFNLGSNKPVT